MVDLFSVSVACLLADVIQFLNDNNIPYHPRIVYDDVSLEDETLNLP
jgi:hypothetical protein